MKHKCYDVLKMVTDVATENLGSTFVENQQRLETLESICDEIDEMFEQYNGASYDVEVDEDTTDILITIECESFIVDTGENDSPFYRAMENTKYVTIKSPDYSESTYLDSEMEWLRITFAYDGIWDTVRGNK